MFTLIGTGTEYRSHKHRSYYAEIKNQKHLLFVKDIHHNLFMAFDVLLTLYDWYNQILVWLKQPVPYNLAEYS